MQCKADMIDVMFINIRKIVAFYCMCVYVDIEIYVLLKI